MSRPARPSSAPREVPDRLHAIVGQDPLATLPMRPSGPAEPSDFLARLDEAMRASSATSSWLKSRMHVARSDD